MSKAETARLAASLRSCFVDEDLLAQHYGLTVADGEAYAAKAVLRPPAERPSISRFLDVQFYLEYYPDVRRAGVDAFRHFVDAGWREGRNPHPLIDTRYIATSQGLKLESEEAFKALVALIRDGAVRFSPYIDREHYRRAAPAVGPSYAEIVVHFTSEDTGATSLSPNGYFDPSWYRAKYPDAPDGNYAVFRHFVAKGDGEGRQPSPAFDPDFYLEEYPEVARARIPPLYHFLRNGQIEGRKAAGAVAFVPRSQPDLECQLRAPSGPPATVVAGGGDVASSEGPPVGLRGRIESYRAGRLTGWAVGEPLSDVPCDVELWIDGCLFARTVPRTPRLDLVNSGLGSGGGFAFDIPALPVERASAEVQVFVNPGHVPLQWSASREHRRPIPPLRRDEAPLQDLNVTRNAYPETVIIIPIYNAADDVEQCLESVVAQTTAPAHLILIDDASPDPRISELTRRYAEFPGVTVVRNPRNLGFTKTANLGLRLAGRRDVVLLNSDTVVTPRWLQNLRNAAYSGKRIGTATAMSDNAGAFSAPERTQPNHLPAGYSQDAYGRAVTQLAASLRPRVPTGNGFCLYIRRDCLDDVGLLDEIAFPRGYGEENDLCMRALRKGWRHVVDDRTLVYHKKGSSFGEERARLLEAGRREVDRRYPEYGSLIRVFEAGFELNVARYRVRRIGATAERADAGLGKPRVLFVISTLTGGTPLTNQDLMGGLRPDVDTFVLHCDSLQLELSRVTDNGTEVLEKRTLSDPVEIATHSSEHYDRLLSDWLIRYSVELVHVRHIGWHSLGLINVSAELGVPVIFSFHDFYTVCPSVKLLDENLEFCAGRCTPGGGDCRVELWKTGAPRLKHDWIEQWRAEMGRVLRSCDAFVTTAESARSQILDTYPELAAKEFAVIRHGRDFEGFRIAGRSAASE